MLEPLRRLVPPTRWPELGWWTYFAIALVLIFAPPIACTARAAGVGFTKAQCSNFASFALQSAEIRDIGARLEGHIELVRRRLAIAGVSLSPVVERELRRVYSEHLRPVDAARSAFERCMSGEIVRPEG